MSIQISPVLGFILGINIVDWGDDLEEYGYRYELQIAFGLFILSFKK
jgi:hypothetical protein|tara:strand:+ start:3846 stop:3986 length:141 start_codon:yes stop_codon:yes gene_type:complete